MYIHIRSLYEALKKHRARKQRGQIRTVDFIVSLLLFLLMLSQLILIIINVQTGFINVAQTAITWEELDLFSRSLLQEQGDPYWGYEQELPNTFGLAADFSQPSLVLDPAKVARLVGNAQIEAVSGYSILDYTTLQEQISLDSEWDFQLAMLPFINVSLSLTLVGNPVTAVQADISVTNNYNVPLTDAQATFFSINLATGIPNLESVVITDSAGTASVQYPILNQADAEYLTIVIVEKDVLWGMNYKHITPHPGNLGAVIGSASTSTLWGSGINASAAIISDNLISTPEQHFLAVIYQNTSSGYSNLVFDLGTSTEGNESITIPDEGIIAFLSIAQFTNEYQVQVRSYPAILDSYPTSGAFYRVFGELTQTPRTKSLLSRIYPVTLRGKLMKCVLTLWSE